MRVVVYGGALTVLVTGVMYGVWGPSALVPGIAFGLLATAIQVVAVRQLRLGLAGPYRELVKRFGIGMGLRLGGVVLFLVAVLIDNVLFPPLPAAFGYLGVIVPLLLAEKKLAQ